MEDPASGALSGGCRRSFLKEWGNLRTGGEIFVGSNC